MKAIIKYTEFNVVERDLGDTDLYCPNCGIKNVKVETGEGDYYQGPSYYCLSCVHSFTISGPGPCTNTTFEE